MESPRILLELVIVTVLGMAGFSIFGGLLEKHSPAVAIVSFLISMAAIAGYLITRKHGLQVLFRVLTIMSSLFWVIIGLMWLIFRKNIFAE